MATYSQGFLNALTRPGYAQNLGMLGRQIGQLPAQAQQQKIMQQQRETLAGFDPNTVEGLAGLATFYQSRGELDKAAQYATASRALRDQIEEKQKTTTEEQEQEEARARLRGVAFQKAAREDDPATAVGRVREMNLEQLMEYTAPEEPKDPIQLVTGARLINPDTGKVMVEARDAPAKQVNLAYELLKTGKYDPESFNYNDDGTLSGDISKLTLAKDDTERGKIPTNVEKRIIDMDVQSGKSTIAFGRARKLKEDLIASPDKKAGVVSALRTQVLDFAGLRDAEEERKTEFLRTRNTDIINSLPAGVASDTDVRIFSQGFPSGDATTDEIIRYLEAEERILAAQSDMSALFQQHVNSQVESGIEATTAGFEDKRRMYANVMTHFRNTIENAVDQQGNPLYSEEDKKRFLQEALGFVPTYYSR